MKYISSVTIPAIFFLLALSGISGAQEIMRPGPPGGDPQNQQHEAQFREWIWNNFQTFLKLDENTAAKFQPIFKEYGTIRGKLMREHNMLIRDIGKDVDNPSVTIRQLRDKAERLKQIDKSLSFEKEKYYQKAKRILNERQQIKLLIFEDKIKEDIFRRMEKRSDERPLPPGPPRR
jgi:hypothetical protein